MSNRKTASVATLQANKKSVVGSRVCWSASPSVAECRRVYTGTIVKDNGDGTVDVLDDGWKATSTVVARFLHSEGSYEITKSGPRGIIWK
jgi:hypothetical protein